MIRTTVCRCFTGASRSSHSIASMKPFTGFNTLARGGDFRFGGTGDSRPSSPCSATP